MTRHCDRMAIFGCPLPYVASVQVFAYVKGMEVHFSPDVETRLQQVASASGRDAEELVKETVARMLDNQARFMAGVKRGIAQADRGEAVEHKEVLDRVDRLFRS
jgi:predicted transcriptional regulator